MKKLILILLTFLFFACTKVLHISEVKPSSTKVDQSAVYEQDTSVLSMIAPYKAQLDQEVNEVIGEAAITMTKAKPQCTLGNWFADLVYEKAYEYYKKPVDFAVINYGGIRIPELRKGPVTRGRIYELMPFENRLVIVKARGEVVRAFFELMAKAGGWPVSKEVRYEIYNGEARNLKIKGKELEVDRTYTVALPDFIANGGGNCDFLIDQEQYDLGALLRTVILEYIEEQTAKGKKLQARLDDRIISLD